MEQNLTNTISITANYKDKPTSFSSDTSSVIMLDGISVSISADKEVWIDKYLTYTIVITNNTSESLTSSVVTDVLDTSLVTFVTGSITINGEKASSDKYSYNEESSTLTINLEDIVSNNNSTITFQVSKKV